VLDTARDDDEFARSEFDLAVALLDR